MHPYTILNTAMSLDGRVKRRDRRQVYTPNKLNEERIQTFRATVDAIMTSVQEVIEHNLDYASREIPGKKKPLKIIIDRGADTPINSKILADKESKIIIVISKGAAKGKIQNLMDFRSDLSIIAAGAETVDLERLMWNLYEKGIRKILLEADQNLNRRMLERGLVDEVYLTVTPYLVGKGADIFEGELIKEITLRLDGIQQYGDHIVLHYLIR